MQLSHVQPRSFEPWLVALMYFKILRTIDVENVPIHLTDWMF